MISCLCSTNLISLRTFLRCFSSLKSSLSNWQSFSDTSSDFDFSTLRFFCFWSGCLTSTSVQVDYYYRGRGDRESAIVSIYSKKDERNWGTYKIKMTRRWSFSSYGEHQVMDISIFDENVDNDIGQSTVPLRSGRIFCN